MKVVLVNPGSAKPEDVEKADAVEKLITDEAVRWAKRLIHLAEDAGIELGLEAGMYRVNGYDCPALALTKEGRVASIAPFGQHEFFTVSPGDPAKYTPGPQVEIVH